MTYKKLLATALAASLALLPAFGQAPSEPTATAVAQIHRSPAQPDAIPLPLHNFIATEAVIMTSGFNLEIAAKDCGIPAADIAAAVRCAPIADTDLVTLKAYHDDEAEAVKMLTSVTNAYIKRRNTVEMQKEESFLSALNIEIQNHADLVNDRRKALTVLVQQYGIPYFEGDQSNPIGVIEKRTQESARERLDELQQSRDQAKIQVQKLLSTPADELIPAAAGLSLPENQVATHYQRYRETQREISERKVSGVGSDHPSMKALQHRSDKAMAEAKAAVKTLKDVLNTRINLMDRQVERMRETVERASQDTIDLSLKQHHYIDAKADYEQARTLLQQLKKKQMEEGIEFRMPRTPLTLHKEAGK